MDDFVTHAELLDRVAAATFDRPPALVANAHVTGLGVARALDAGDVPVIAVDRTGDGVAPPSTAVDFAGAVTYPLDDPAGFRDDVAAIADAAGTDLVAFGCMDEWVHALADTAPDGVRLPFAGTDVIDAVLDKSSLYRVAEDLGVPYPETRWLAETSVETVVEDLGLPLIVKPARKREFEAAIGTNVVKVDTVAECRDIVTVAADEDIEVLAQETVPVARGTDTSLASYVPPSGVADALGVVGTARVRNPRGFGTACVVERSHEPAVEAHARAILDATGYHGTSEAEFVYDRERETYVLLDVNTRPWKWIDLPVTAGANLPMAAYAAVTDTTYESAGVHDATWVSLPDYVDVLATDGVEDILAPSDWRAFLSGAFETRADLTAAVYRPSDPDPTAQQLRTLFGGPEYYCSC
jgi:predicted ATP-grasp superfamily ATP-dependent carboligase